MPSVAGFVPYGDDIAKDKDPVILHYEEYESLKLSDYDGHTQCESSEVMGISRPTFTRIYMSAREKIAKAFVEGRKIIVEGGKFDLNRSKDMNMKIAISSRGNTANSLIDPRFGRCGWFAFYDTATGETEFVENSAKNADSGAGPAAVTIIAQKGVSKIVSGEFGFKIKDMLKELNIEMVMVKEDKTIQEIIDTLNSKNMTNVIAIPVTEGILSSHFGHCEQFYFATIVDGKISEEKMVTPPAHEPGLYPKWVKEQGATLVIGGGMGQKARDLFAAQNLEAIVGAPTISPRDVVESYLAGDLVTSQNTCNHKEGEHEHGACKH